MASCHNEDVAPWICIPIPAEHRSKVRTIFKPVSPLAEFVQRLETVLLEADDEELLDAFYEGDIRRLMKMKKRVSKPSGNEANIKDLV